MSQNDENVIGSYPSPTREQVVQHEGEPLGWAERLEYKKQRRAYRVGEDRFFFGIDQFGLGPSRSRKGSLW